MWWWSGYGPTPMFFGPMMMFVFMAICMAGMFFIMRAMHRHRNETGVVGGVRGCSAGAWPLGYNRIRGTETPDSKHSAFEDYRAQTLQRLDQEQREFQEFIARLRAAKDKAEFEQFMAERRMPQTSLQA
jgi:hypothetical protein